LHHPKLVKLTKTIKGIDLMRATFLLLVCFLLMAPAAAQPDDDLLHIPSPEWQDQVIYFILTDRFNDGDPSNNDQGADEYDPEDRRKFSGGDLQGIIDQIDYIQGLGATAIWITPPVANQWWDPMVGYGGYHGYWAIDFTQVDPHYGDLATYQDLSRTLHANDMYLIQDIVANHTGNFFSYEDWDADDPTAGVVFNENTVPVTVPSQTPFDLNDPTNPNHLAAAIYNWTPAIQNFGNDTQVVEWALADLDDLNTTNPVVREALKESYTYWIETVGVDGFRIDTVKHVEQDFWTDFIHSENGVHAAATATGRDDFLGFGEVFFGSDPFDDSGEQVVASYLGTTDQPALNSVLNFPMYYTINDVFANAAPTAEMAYRLEAAQRVYPDVSRLPVFIDNHDVDRFLANGNEAGLKQSLLFVMTTPGIPVIYYGTEQGFADRRASMFAEGYGSNGQDHFDTESEMYQFTRDVTTLRTANRIFTRGTLTTLPANEVQAGVLAYTRAYEDDVALILFNTADAPILVNELPTGLPEGTILRNLYGIHSNADITLGANGTLTTELAAREGLVLLATGETAVVEYSSSEITITSDLSGTLTEDIVISGTTTDMYTMVKLVLNGLVEAETEADTDGNWTFTLPIQNFPLGVSEHSVQVFTSQTLAISETVTFETDVAFVGERIVISDPAGDDSGPYGNYLYPTDETFTEQMDIIEAAYTVSGSNLLIELTMAEVTTVWNPINGFDHTLFHIYVDLPGVESDVTALPNQNATFADGFTWDRFIGIEGWNIFNFAPDGADANNWGTSLNALPEVSVDGNTISVLLTSDVLGNPETLDGVRLYISTWDWDGPAGGYRGLLPNGGQWVFGGAPSNFPFAMDDITLGWEPDGVSALALDETLLADLNRPEYEITINVTVPDITPEDADLYLAGPFNRWSPNDSRYQFEQGANGLYTLTLTARDGDELEFRITRGSFANAEKLDPDSRTANHELTVTDNTTVDIAVDGWWDD
jgi:glycosidase